MLSSKQTPTIWLDLTMLINWHGQLTGIQRVEYNIAKRYVKEPNARFCYFDKARRAMFSCDFSQVETKIQSLQSQNQQESAAEIDSPRPSLHLLRRVAVTVLPKPAKNQIKKLLNQTKKKSAAHSHSSQESVNFKPEDTLLILSGDWSDDTFADLIAELKSAQAFKIGQIIYDMLPATQPAFFVPGMPEQFSRYMEKIFSLADIIFAISKATKDDILGFQKTRGLLPVTIKVFRLGEDFVKLDPIKPKMDIVSDKYVLCVGTIEARKNHMLLYYAMKEAIRLNKPIPPIVIAGKRGWLVEDFLYLTENDPQLKNKIMFINNATDQELAWLFKNCLFTVYPSLYEGWGLPVAESLFYGKFCLASNSSSIPEVAGDLIDYFSPTDPHALFELMVEYDKNPKALEQKVARMKRSYNPTSWDDTFNEVRNTLK